VKNCENGRKITENGLNNRERIVKMIATEERLTAHLQGMVQIPTISSADQELMDTAAYFKLHDYLEQTYPLAHKALRREVVSKASLLYHWPGTGHSGKLPLLLAAHLDVVPPGEPGLWKYPPFSGAVAEGCLWGRGATDSKMNILAQLEAVEQLLQEGFQPDYDVYLAYGHNEETMSLPESGAAAIAELLRARGVKLGCVIDECGGPTDGSSYDLGGKPTKFRPEGLIAQIYVAEKGQVNFELVKESPGGHSSTPGPSSALGAVCRAAVILEENLRLPRLTDFVEAELRALGSRVSGEVGELLRDPRANWEKLLPLLLEEPQWAARLRTTTAVTMAKGSDQANVLPERASIVVNCRLLAGDTYEELWEYFQGLAPAGVEVKVLKALNPAPAAAVETASYRLIKAIAEETYPGILIVPSFLLGATDSRFYFAVCESGSVYRYSGFFRDADWGAAHKVNERIPLRALRAGVDFFIQYIRRYGSFV
jgi:carboxypeptidase PM20D1